LSLEVVVVVEEMVVGAVEVVLAVIAHQQQHWLRLKLRTPLPLELEVLEVLFLPQQTHNPETILFFHP
jgi:hypothetical protein